jgi:hypothetical protein
MVVRSQALVASVAVALVLAASAESASGAIVYRGTARTGSVTAVSLARWDIFRYRLGASTRIGYVARVPGAAGLRWNVYRGTSFAGYVARGPVGSGRWVLFRLAREVGYVRLVAGRWWAYRRRSAPPGYTRVGYVAARPPERPLALPGPAGGAALLLLI